MNANRTCALCGLKQNMRDMLKVGKDFLCSDKVECYKRKLDNDDKV